MKFYIKTSYPCLIKTDSQSVFLEENDMLEIENEKFLYIYPENNTYFPFFLNMDTLKDSEKISVLKHNNQIIVLLENPPTLQIYNKETLNFSGKTCEIHISKNNLSFSTNSKKINFFCKHSCKNYKIFKIQNFACVQFEKNLYAFSVSSNKLTHFEGDKFEFNNNILHLTKRFHDSLDRERHACYKFDNEIFLESEEFMYKEEKQYNEKLICYKTLEGVKAKDFSYILNNFFSEKLKSQINEKQLHKFFGNISSFLPMSTTEYITLAKDQKNYVTFSIKDDKIDDITIDKL